MKIPRYLEFYIAAIGCLVFSVCALVLRADYVAAHQPFPVWWFLGPLGAGLLFLLLYRNAKRRLMVLLAALGIQSAAVANLLLVAAGLAALILLGIAGCGLKKGLDRVNEIERKRQEAMTNASPEEIVMVSLTWEQLKDQFAIVENPADANEEPPVAAAAPLPKSHTMRSDDLGQWVSLDDDRDLWTIAREAAKSGKRSEFFYRDK